MGITTRILHLSDLHIKQGDTIFIEKLKSYLKPNNFQEGIDFLVVSGDLGDRGDIENCAAAKEFLKEVVKNLKLSNNQVIFCAGNHDICTETVDENHRTQCYAYENGVRYIGNNENLQRSFERYESFNSDFPFDPSLTRITSRNDYIYETKSVRFIVINSSWLSQFNFGEHERLRKGLIALENEEDFEKEIRANFNGAYCLPKGETLDKGLAFKLSFNYNENTRQQVDSEILEYLNNHSEKLNLLIQHHPRECLHYLDHHEVSGMQNSGKYVKIEQYADAVLCGHIHPKKDNSPNMGAGNALQFIGAACHLEVNENKILTGVDINEKNRVLDRPRFYYYTFQKNTKGFNSNKAIYTLNKEGTFDKRVVTIPSNNLSHQNDEQQNEECFGISNEITIEELRKKFEDAYLKLINDLFNRNEKRMVVQSKKIKFDRTYYQVTSELNEIIVEEKVYIYIDIIGIHDLYKIQHATSKIEKLSDKESLRREAKIPDHISDDKILYYPIIVDTLAGASLINQHTRIKKIASLLGDRRNENAALNLFLINHFGNAFLDNSDLKNTKNVFLLQKRALESLTNGTFNFNANNLEAANSEDLFAQIILK